MRGGGNLTCDKKNGNVKMCYNVKKCYCEKDGYQTVEEEERKDTPVEEDYSDTEPVYQDVDVENIYEDPDKYGDMPLPPLPAGNSATTIPPPFRKGTTSNIEEVEY